LISRKPAFWILLSLTFAGGVFFTFRYFSEAFPIVTLDLRMDRVSALEAARSLADKRHWGPQGFSQVASFELDSHVQSYIELEVGGSRGFSNLLQERLYLPYTWQVRQFKEGETNETLVLFTPEGHPYGFREKLPEAAPGAGLKPEAARQIAERAATENWGVNLAEYVLVEPSQETRSGGRIDHTFVYERPNRKIGEGLYRLRLVVGGDKLTELAHFIKVPEAFGRRYEEMRSSNETIATLASFAMLLFYILGGCVVGLFFLLRQGWILWRAPLLWGFFVALLNLVAGLCEMPLRWRYYDTALSAREFLVQQLLSEVGGCLLWTLLLTLTFMAAESLTRRAFPHMIQYWKLWSAEAASSTAVLGRTVGGYLIVGFDFAFVVAIYFLTTRHFGWWTPSDVLFQPNVLATYFPWVSPIAQSLRAGFWEECLFRAVPLAGAALLGQRFGGRKWFIAGAFLMQALIFGAGHANYPSQPSYARLVELIVPSFVFGGIYLVFGLLPAVISHFVFDVVWFSIPLFVSTARGIWIDQTLIVLLTLTPVWVVLRSRLKLGRWGSLSEDCYNHFWRPSERLAPEARENAGGVVASHPVLSRGWLLGIGGAGLALWLLSTGFKQEAPRLGVGRQEAARLASQALEKQGGKLAGDWRVLPSLQGGVDTEDRFVWQSGGREIYRRLMASYIAPPGWNVRFARFEGDIVQRAEEFGVAVVRDGEVVRVRHRLPESAPGPRLAEAEARLLALQAVETQFKIKSGQLQEISAVVSKLPNRSDWAFTFSDPQNYPMKEGQARISVNIAGDQISDTYRFVFVPEEWRRKERSQRNIAGLIRIACWSLLGLAWLAAAIMAVVQWSRRNFSVRVFLQSGVLLFTALALSRLNQWPEIQAGLSTAEPLSNQLMVIVAGGLVGALLQAVLFALILGYLARTKPEEVTTGVWEGWMRGAAVGLSVAGCTALFARLLAPSLAPEFANQSHAGTWLPWLSGLVGGVNIFVTSTATVLLVFAVLCKLPAAGALKSKRLILLFVVFGLVVTGMDEIETLTYWLASGFLLGVLLWLAFAYVFRTQLSIVPTAVASVLILGAVIQTAYLAFPSTLLCGVAESAAIAVLATFAQVRLGRNELTGARGTR